MNLVRGAWGPSHGGATFEDRNPSRTSDLLGVFPRSNAQDADAAVRAARAAFPTWKRLSFVKRGELLDNFVQLVKADKEQLAQEMARECGKSVVECLADVVEGIHCAQYWAGRARMPWGDVISSELEEKDAFALRKPKGVVVCIPPWNFPFAIPLWLVCPSLVAGNTVVLKPAEETPLMGQRIVEYMERAGFPLGVVNLVHGFGEEAGWPLVVHPDVNVVLFTGSAEVGMKIKEQCAKETDKFAVCEMGGKNAMIVFEDCDFDLAVDAAVISAFRTSGQRCVSASRIIVQGGPFFDKFAQAFVEKAKGIVIGDATDPRTFMGPMVNEAGVEKFLRYKVLAKAEGAKVLLDGGRLTEGAYREGWFVSPFVYVMEHRSNARVLREEVFAPHVALIPFKTTDDAVRIYNDTDYGFSLAVHTRDYRKVRHLREECDFGVGYVNLPTIGAEVHLPFGGIKKSGSGIPSATGLLAAVTHQVAWTVNHGTEIRLAQGLSGKTG
ncbi:MAG: aldehyde dehydrogenase family protein [SAR202 cluster bacterium]|nr:aldehyde dehydrogenase family protein [SAR202 cluster bacterium]